MGPLRLPLPSRPLHGSSPLIGSDSPSPPPWLAHHKGLTAGEETGLSCSHDGYPSVPRPIRRRVLRCCSPQVLHTFHGLRPRTPGSAPCWPPSGGFSYDAADFALCCGPEGCTLLSRARPRASTPRSPRTPAGCYKGGLVPPLAGLSPASHRELTGRTIRCESLCHPL